MKCRHQLNPAYCAVCINESLDETFSILAGSIAGTQGSGLIFSNKATGQPAVALYPSERRLEPVLNRSVDSIILSVQTAQQNKALLEKAQIVCIEMASLFVPGRPLTKREQEDIGPSKCTYCKRPLSFEVSGVACTKDGYYVCRCGACLCGFKGRNYKGEYFEQPGPPPCTRKERQVLLKILRSLEIEEGLALPVPKLGNEYYKLKIE